MSHSVKDDDGITMMWGRWELMFNAIKSVGKINRDSLADKRTVMAKQDRTLRAVPGRVGGTEDQNLRAVFTDLGTQNGAGLWVERTFQFPRTQTSIDLCDFI